MHIMLIELGIGSTSAQWPRGCYLRTVGEAIRRAGAATPVTRRHGEERHDPT